MRKKVVGEDYVARALEKGSSDFMRPLQQFATVCTPLCFPSSIPYTHPTFGARNARLMRETNQIQESAWGTIWTRPGLSLRDRSLLNLVMLTSLGKWIELGTHVRGAVRNGVTEVEIREALLQAS
jgi:4-carboxymuconolactone decarboxylase